jgi:muconolactone delta-isomerase
MPKYLVLYRSPTSAQEQMANATPEQAQEGMAAWQSWMEGAGGAIVDFGAPVRGEGDVTGYSILQADSRGDLDEVLSDHPHRQMPGATIDVMEFVALLGTE